jgi:hypothetical protein
MVSLAIDVKLDVQRKLLESGALLFLSVVG